MAKYYLSDLLKNVRSERGLIQEEFAKELGISVAALKKRGTWRDFSSKQQISFFSV